MAQVDSRIAMGVQPIDVGASIGRGYQLRDLAAQADARKLDTQLKQQAVQKQKTLGDLYRGALGPDGKIDRTKVTQGVVEAGFGADLPDMQKQWSDADKAEADYFSKNSETIVKQLDYTSKTIGALLQNPNTTAQDVARAVSGLTQFGLLKPEQGAEIVRSIPGDPVQLRQYLQGKLMESQQAKDMLTAALPNLKEINLGGHTQLVDTNTITNPGVVGQQFQRTASPESELSASTAVRGQDMTDARARDLNATKVEENKLKREAKDGADQQAKASQLASFDTMLGTLDRLSNHAGLARSVGVYGALPTMPGSDSANFQAELETFKSQAFIPMVAQLKGMGALSDAEGKKLSAAVGALDPKMGEKAFRESIGRIIADMKAARDRMAGGAKQASPAAQSASGGVLSPQQSTNDQLLNFAKQAIEQGAPREKVIERLRSMGISTEGL